MIKTTYIILAIAAIMFMCGDISKQESFAIWGVMFMSVAAIFTIVGTNQKTRGNYHD